MVIGLVVAVCILFGAFFWWTTPAAAPGEIRLAPQTPYAQGPYFAYVQPWGGETWWPTRWWSHHADAMVIDHRYFPADSQIHWRWPPFLPRNDAGVWGYDAVMYGQYDGGMPEKEVPAIQVANIKELSETFEWSLAKGFGDANVLNEFYLFAGKEVGAEKKIEIGFLLHLPPAVRAYYEGRPSIGQYIDEKGRHWTVRMGGTYCMFAPEKPGDVVSGSLDLLAAIRWLESKGKVHGDDWFSGVAIGVEPVRGVGSLTLRHWQVVLH